MKRGLGKGLDALFADNSTDTVQNSSVTLKLSEIEPNRDQPRKSFGEEALRQLAESIKENGILQPLMVRPMSGRDHYQLVAGERRWRAARMAGLSEVPVIIRDLDDLQVTAIALIENLQREDLNPVEEAEGYRTLMETFNLTQEEAAKKVGKSRPTVTNALRLLNLPEQVLTMVKKGDLSQGHARAFLAMDNQDDIKQLANETITKGLSVREVERLVKRVKQGETSNALDSPPPFSVVSNELEKFLTNRLGRKVNIRNSKSKGFIQIEFYGEDDLKLLAEQITNISKE